MHDEVFESTHDSANSPKDGTAYAASSPSEAYANLTLDCREGAGSMAPESETPAHTPTHADQPPPPRRPPRSSSPAKRPHSDMDDTGKDPMDVDTPAGSARRSSGQGSPRATKPLPAASQRSLRATSVDMLDVSANAASDPTSETTSVSNQDSTATSVSVPNGVEPSGVAPSLDEQVANIMAIHNKPISEGQEGYVISEKWLERVWARTSENSKNPSQFDKSAIEGDIGPIDNSNLVDPVALSDDLADQNGDDFVPMKPGMTLGHEYEILPLEAWELIIGWYGMKEGSPVIRRYVHNTALEDFQENLQYEVYPPIFTIRKLRKPASATVNERRAPKIVASRNDGYQEFLRAAKKAVDIDIKTKVQVWRILSTTATAEQTLPTTGIPTPESSPRNLSPASSSRPSTPPLSIDLASFLALTEGTEREMVTGKDETANEKYNGHMNLQLAGLAEDQVLVLEEQDDKGEYASETANKVAIKNGVLLGNKNKGTKGPQSNTNSGRSSPALSGPMTRGRTRNGRTRGTVGLTNLGNTCYMNSALQCIRSVEELSLYFIHGKYKEDLNSDNPLGHGGAIAKSYASLLASIYDEAGVSSFAPKAFKMALGRAQPLFSGYGQQDSQEFLSFLVDGLHEDLNRIKKKPYTENPESDDNTVHDPEAIKALGEKIREIHRSRNDSVAMDLFNGFYKNTMVCPECDKVSITFDPYSLLTLQLPIEQTWTHTIRWVPLRGKILDIEVDIDKNSTIKALKEHITKRPGIADEGIDWSRVMGAEVYSHKFYRVLENNKSISECNIGARDDIYFFELDAVPSNWPPKKKSQRYRSNIYPSSEEDIPSSDSPAADRMLVPIFHRGPSMSTYRSSQWQMCLWPSYIVLTREEAKDYDTILRKIIGKVAQMTTRPILEEFGSTSPFGQSRSGSDVVLTTEEDAEPNGDPRVHDGSVEGEESMVEVTMDEPVDPATAELRRNFKEEPYEILRPGAFIPPEYRALFEIKHTRAGKELVPTGWSSVDNNKPYEPISKRIRKPSRQSSVQSLDETSNVESSDETDDNPQFSFDPQSSIAMAEQSSDEDAPPVSSIETASDFPGRGGRQKRDKKNRRKKNKKGAKGFKQNGRKGKDRFAESSQTVSDPEPDDDEALIRLGEALVLEWNAQAFDALFQGSGPNDPRGMEISKSVDKLVDQELEDKKRRRAVRRRNGITLEECFAETSKSEVLSEDNAWYCNRCKELRRATKTLEIWTVPDILVVHLKRFSAHRTFRDKIEALVDFPIEGLDLSGKVGLPEGKDLIYDLFAVDNHYGGLGGGHYTAYAQNFFDKKWYEYNDSSVSSQNNPENVVTPNAYLLFYRRRSDRPLGPDYLQKIVDSFHNPDSEEADESTGEGNSRNPSRSPAGNGSRLDGSSRNGSSSAFAAAAGVPALRGGGSASVASLQQRGVGVATADDDDDDMLLDHDADDPPPYADEGYGGDDDYHNAVNMDTLCEPLYKQQPVWDFSAVGTGTGTIGVASMDGNEDDAFEDAASDAPNLGSEGSGADLQSRMMEDFGDEVGVGGFHPGMSTPLEEEVPGLLAEERDDEVADVLLDDEPMAHASGHVKED